MTETANEPIVAQGRVLPERDYPALLRKFDPFNPEHVGWRADAFAYARQHCPVPRNESLSGFWLITKYEDLRRVSEDHETFSSAPSSSPAAIPTRLGPLDADPPMHTGLRKLLNPLFSRTYSLRFADDIRGVCRDLIEDFIDDGKVDVVNQYSGPMVSRVLAKMVFDDVEDDPEKMARAVHIATRAAEEPSNEAFAQLAELAAEYLAKATASPPEREGVLRALVTGEIDGKPIPAEEALGSLTVIFLGGLDTTKSAVGHIAFQIAQHPELEARVRDPRWVRHDMDEFIRLQSPVCTNARTVTRNVEFGGVQMKAGERVLLRWDSANRDYDHFPNGDELQFDPPRGGNAGFGLGIHRCLGVHLARVQIAIAFEELLARVTNLRLGCDPSEVVWKPGIANAPALIPIQFDKTS
jgi:cytochrome P450